MYLLQGAPLRRAYSTEPQIHVRAFTFVHLYGLHNVSLCQAPNELVMNFALQYE